MMITSSTAHNQCHRGEGVETMLTEKQIEKYNDQGAIVVEGIADSNTLTQMKQVLADLVEKSRKVSQHDDVYDLEDGHAAREPRVRRIKSPHLVDKVFDDFMRSPKILSIAQTLIGPDVRLH